MTEVKRATRTVTLYVGGDLDLVDEYARLEAEAANPTSLAGADTGRLEQVRAELAEGTMAFRFQALGRRSLQKLLDANPPRKDKNNDQMLGFNEDTATDALIRKCLIDPDLSEADLTELLEEQLTDGQYEKLSAAVWSLNRRSVDVPLSLTASTPPRNSSGG